MVDKTHEQLTESELNALSNDQLLELLGQVLLDMRKGPGESVEDMSGLAQRLMEMARERQVAEPPRARKKAGEPPRP